jgi:Tol biopolymer transport system component
MFERRGAGSRSVHVLEITPDSVVPPVILLAGGPGWWTAGGWSPGGSAVAATWAPSGEDTLSQVAVVRADGSGFVNITTGDGRRSGPVWSPSGDSIAFIEGVLIVVEARDGTGRRSLTVTADSIVPPLCWSPDGARFVVTTFRSGRSDIVVVHGDGTAPENLTQIMFPGSFPQVLPDGRQIAYVADLRTTTRIFVTDFQGLGNRPLTVLTVNEFEPSARRPAPVP